jgi:hypothetical protein
MTDTPRLFELFTDDELGALAMVVDGLDPAQLRSVATQGDDVDVDDLVTTAGLTLGGRPYPEVLAALADQALRPFAPDEFVTVLERDPHAHRRLLMRAFADDGRATTSANDLLDVAVAAAAGRASLGDVRRAMENVCRADMIAAPRIIEEVGPEIDVVVEATRRSDETAALQALRSQFRRFQEAIARRLDQLVAGLAPPPARVLDPRRKEHIGVLRIDPGTPGPFTVPDELLATLGDDAQVELSSRPGELTVVVRDVRDDFAGALYVGAATTGQADRDEVSAAREGDVLNAVMAWSSGERPDVVVLGTIEM